MYFRLMFNQARYNNFLRQIFVAGTIFQILKTPFVIKQPPFRRTDVRNIYREFYET